MSLRPADVEAALIEYLAPLGVNVGTTVPNPAPAGFIRVSRTGGGRPNVIEERPTMLFECWAADSVAAFDLASSCWELVAAAGGSFIAAGVWCDDPDPSMPINFPDPTYETRNRYQFYAPMTFALKEAS